MLVDKESGSYRVQVTNGHSLLLYRPMMTIFSCILGRLLTMHASIEVIVILSFTTRSQLLTATRFVGILNLSSELLEVILCMEFCF